MYETHKNVGNDKAKNNQSYIDFMWLNAMKHIIDLKLCYI